MKKTNKKKDNFWIIWTFVLFAFVFFILGYSIGQDQVEIDFGKDLKIKSYNFDKLLEVQEGKEPKMICDLDSKKCVVFTILETRE